MRFNCGANLRPLWRVDPDPAIFYRKAYRGWICNEFWCLRCTRLPVDATGATDQFSKTCCDERGCVSLTIAFHRRAQQLRCAAQNVYSAILGISAQTNHCGNVEMKFPECLRQTVCGPVLFLARNAGAGTEITNQVGLAENDSCRAIDF